MSRIPDAVASRLLALALVLLAASGSRAEDAQAVRWPDAARRAEISRPFGGSDIVVGVSSRTAGAIDSLTWNGRQFVNDFDHGRELQSASSFNQWGECFNPTEAGSASDGAGQASTSRLNSLRASGGRLETRSEMAFWLRPGETSPNCPGIDARNRALRSTHTLAKTVTIGALRVPNAIEHRVTFGIPEAYESGTFEALTGYMPAAFSQFWTYDPAQGRRAPLSDTAGDQALPVIFSTPDGAHAMGVYSPDLPQKAFPSLGYGRFRFAQLPGPGNATVKWNCVFREANLKPGDRTYTCYTLVGSLGDVESGMKALAAAARKGRRADEPEAAPAATPPIRLAQNAAGGKYCSAVAPGNWRDTFPVPNSWTTRDCIAFAQATGAQRAQAICLFESGEPKFSAGGEDGSAPARNCGW